MYNEQDRQALTPPAPPVAAAHWVSVGVMSHALGFTLPAVALPPVPYIGILMGIFCQICITMSHCALTFK